MTDLSTFADVSFSKIAGMWTYEVKGRQVGMLFRTLGEAIRMAKLDHDLATGRVGLASGSYTPEELNELIEACR